MQNERSFETGRISIMRGSRRVLVKVVLFQLRGRGHPQDDATPNFFLILNALYKHSLFQKFFGKVFKINQTSFLLSKCLFSFEHHCTLLIGQPIMLYKSAGSPWRFKVWIKAKLSTLGNAISSSDAQHSVSWFFQPKTKSPWTFSLLHCRCK